MSNKYVWNYECIRDFAGSYYGNIHNRNEALICALPEAVDMFAKLESEQNGTSEAEEKEEIIKMIINDYPDDNSMVDYRTGIDCKKVIIDCLSGSKKPTDEELAAILDVIYIDNISSQLESCALKIIDSKYPF